MTETKRRPRSSWRSTGRDIHGNSTYQGVIWRGYTQLWQCNHVHKSKMLAQACADKKLLGRGQHREGTVHANGGGN